MSFDVNKWYNDGRKGDTMKCDNCGYTFKKSLACPLCGHHHGKVYNCSVCGTVIYHGQGQCPNCGNPTKYQKKENITKKYRISDNKEDFKHSKKKHVYQSQDMYDYKSSDHEIKRRLDEGRVKLTGKKTNITKPKLGIERNILNLLIIGIVVVLLAIIFNFLTSENTDVKSVDLDQIEVNGNNSDLMMAGNFQQNGLVYLNEDDIYLGCDYQLNIVDRKFSNKVNLDIQKGNVLGNIYVEDSYIYYNDYGTYVRYDQNTKEIVKLFEGDNIFPIKNHRFLYLIDNSGLYLYQDGESILIANNDIFTYTLDFKTELVYFENEGAIRVIDLKGAIVKDYDIYVSGNLYVDNGVIYYDNMEGICSFDTKTDSLKTYVENDEVFNFIVSDKGIIYLDYNNNLYSYIDDRTYLIGQSVYYFNVLGDKVIYSSDEGEYGWYITDGETVVSKFLS